MMRVTLPKGITSIGAIGFDKELMDGAIVDVKGMPLNVYSSLIKTNYIEEVTNSGE